MLSISRFSEDKEGILKGLKKRKFDNFEIIDKIIDLDISRKKLQHQIQYQKKLQKFLSLINQTKMLMSLK